MSRLVDVDTTKGGSASATVTLAEEAQLAKVELPNGESREIRKARLAEIYYRGFANDRLDVQLPKHLYGEWVPFKDGGVAIDRKKALGFKIDTEYATKRALHDASATVGGGSAIGDCVYMVCDMETKEILDEIRIEKFKSMHEPKGGKAKEEREFLASAPAETLPSAESAARVAKKADITAAIEAASRDNTSQ